VARANLQSELSVLIEPGHRECFHQYLSQGLVIEMDYQVIQGGELDISLIVSSPTNRAIVSELRKPSAQHKFRTEEVGEYHFCFDNTYSRFAPKKVFFYLGSQDAFVDPHFTINSIYDNPANMGSDKLGELEDKLEGFRATFTKVIKNLELAQRFQTNLKQYDLMDSIQMVHNKSKVDFWSIINIVLMISVGLVQVFMIRSLFEDKSKVGRVLRGGGSSSAGTQKSSFT